MKEFIMFVLAVYAMNVNAAPHPGVGPVINNGGNYGSMGHMSGGGYGGFRYGGGFGGEDFVMEVDLEGMEEVL